MSDTAARVYGTSAVKRCRRTRAALGGLLEAIKGILDKETGAITIRHLFYLLVSQRALEKEERAYHSLCKHLAKWRRSGELRWGAFADSSRWWLRTETFANAEAALRNTAETYRKDLWLEQSRYIELWCEKDAIASILHDAAEPFGVAVFPLRGFASLSSLSAAAGIFRRQCDAGKTVIVYYFGDHDPSGLAIDATAARTLKKDFGLDVEFNRVAVTPAQIRAYKLPLRPTKKTDGRAKNFRGGSVEVDAIPPAVLRSIAKSCITSNLDAGEWERLQKTEELERESLNSMLRNFPIYGGGGTAE